LADCSNAFSTENRSIGVLTGIAEQPYCQWLQPDRSPTAHQLHCNALLFPPN
jgi:hypothetical protein